MVARLIILGHCSLLLWTFIAASTVYGQTDASRKLKDAVAQFNTRLNEARNGVIAEYQRAITLIKNAPNYTASTRKDKLEAWTNARKLFEESGKFPKEDEFAEIELKYCLKVNRAFVPTSKIINDTIEYAIKTNNKTMADDAQEKKTKLEERLLGASNFTSNSAWHGTFQRNKETIPFHLNVGKKADGGSFKGHVEDNPGVSGNWSYDVEGQISGLGVEFVMTKSTRGKFQHVKAVGIISGDRLIAEVTQTVGGKTGMGLLILNKK